MARITINLDDELERKVRTQISKNGGKKGALTKTIEEALRLWLKKEKNKKTQKKEGD